MKVRNVSKTIAIGLLLAPLIAAAETRVAVTFTGGFETDARDRGRPVVLIANALGVKPEVFREAFSHVNPARGGAPTDERVHDNKRALLGALAQYGVTNARLDEVSDFYRYRRENGEHWASRPAKGYAVVRSGKVVKIVVTDGGAGYSSAPTALVNGARVRTTVAYGKDLKQNGRVSAAMID